jgi:cytochrome c2
MAHIVSRLGAVVRRAAVVVALAMPLACDRADEHLDMLVHGGDAERGRTIIKKYGCNTCHTIPGVAGANSLVGPPLTGIAQRMYIGGVTTNTPEHMVSWIENPKQFDSKTAMPNVGVSHRDAVDIASYLYTLK